MKHPEPAEWMEFLYGEVTRERRVDLDAHLAVCPDCVRRIGRWRETMGSLDAAGVPERVEPRVVWQPFVKWAAAAATVLGIGFALGRQGTVSETELAERLGTLRTQLHEDLAGQRTRDLQQVADATVQVARQENREFLQEFLRQYQQSRSEDRRTLLGALRELDELYAAETTRLRDGLSSLASSTGTGFEQTQTQMRLLAGSLPETLPNLSKPNEETP